MSQNYVLLERKVWSKFKLLRKPTDEELIMIANDEIFDTEGLIDWDIEHQEGYDLEEDYSFGQIDVVCDGQVVYHRTSNI